MSCFVSQAPKTQTRLSYIQIFTAPPSATQTQTWTLVSPLFGEAEKEWGEEKQMKRRWKKDQQTEQLHLFNRAYSERARGNRTNYWLRSGQEAELSVAACAASSFN